MKKLTFFSVFLLFIYSVNISVAQKDPEIIKAVKYLDDIGEVYFKFTVTPEYDLQNITRIISIHKVINNEVYAYANQKEFDKFLAYNLDFEVLPHTSDLYKDETGKVRENRDIWDFDTYPTYNEYLTMMSTYETNYPDLCRIVELGTTVDGRKQLFAVVSDNVNVNEPEPRIIYTGAIHGNELVGYPLLLRLVNHLLTNYGTDSEITDIVDNTEIWIMPLENPDGTYAGGNNTVWQATRNNANWVDLNRNYPNPEEGDHPDGESWQPEALTMMGLTDTLHFVLAANIHSGTEVVNYPWDSWTSNNRPHADNDWWELVSHEFADEAQANGPNGFMDNFDDGVTNGGDWYVIYGSRQDYMTYYARNREFTLELANSQSMPESQLQPHWDYLHQSLLKYIKQSRYGISGIITDACTGEPVVAEVFIESHDTDNSQVYSELPHGDYYRPVYEGTYNVTFSAAGYPPQTHSVTLSNYETYTLDIEMSLGYTLSLSLTSSNESSPGAADGSATANPSGGVIPCTYLWDNNTGGQTTQTASNLNTGDYSVTVTDANGCTITDIVHVGLSTKIEETSVSGKYMIYPNPATNMIIIETSDIIPDKVEIINVLGKTIFSRTNCDKINIFNLNRLGGNLYFIRIYYNKQEIFTEKIIVY